MIRSLLLNIVLITAVQSVEAQGIQSFRLSDLGSPLPGSNSVDAITISGDTIWFGTGSGLSASLDGTSWRNFGNTLTFDDKSIAAIAVNDEILWVSAAYNERRDDATIPTGAGLHWTTDLGTTWTYLPQPVDAGTVDTIMYGINKIAALAVTVPQQNVTYDIALSTNTVWIASWASGLRKSTDRGQTWERVVLPPDNLNSIAPSDTLDFDLAASGGALNLRPNYNHVAFSVHASDDTTIWAGTAAGINKSTDGGISWQRFSHQNQSQPISGNFVVGLNEQVTGAQRIMWAATVNAVDQNEFQAVSFSDDGGATWSVTLIGERAHNIAFNDSIVYVATNRGVFRSADRGQSWLKSGTVYDPTNNQRFTTETLYAVGAKGDTVWVGGPEGAAYTIDGVGQTFGTKWRVFRTYEPAGKTASTYSYPSPFSPGDEFVRLHYSTNGVSREVTIRIFDFGMQPVKTLIQNAPRSGLYEHDELWDGRDDRGNTVSNGVYFYRIKVGGREEVWGKILVLR